MPAYQYIALQVNALGAALGRRDKPPTFPLAVIYSATSPEWGHFGSRLDLNDDSTYPWQPHRVVRRLLHQLLDFRPGGIIIQQLVIPLVDGRIDDGIVRVELADGFEDGRAERGILCVSGELSHWIGKDTGGH